MPTRTAADDAEQRRLVLGVPGRALLRPLAMFAASRLLVLVAAAVGALISATAERAVLPGPWPIIEGTGWPAADGLLRWDSAWYVDVAEQGYSTDPASPRNAFFPLFPMLVRAAAGLPGLSTSTAGLLVATLAGAGATVAVWMLARHLTRDDAAADRAAAVFAFFPGAFALSMAYSEGLFIGLAALCLLALCRRRWVTAGVLAALSTATRPTGVAVLAACTWAALTAVRRDRDLRSLAAPLLAPVGTLAFFAYLAHRTGDRLAWFTAQREAWREQIDLLATVRRFGVVFTDPAGEAGAMRDVNALVPVLGTVLAVLALGMLARWRPPGPLVVYALVALGLALVSSTIGTRPRMLLAAFPLVMALGIGVRGSAHTALLGLCAGATALLTVLAVATSAATP